MIVTVIISSIVVSPRTRCLLESAQRSRPVYFDGIGGPPKADLIIGMSGDPRHRGFPYRGNAKGRKKRELVGLYVLLQRLRPAPEAAQITAHRFKRKAGVRHVQGEHAD